MRFEAPRNLAAVVAALFGVAFIGGPLSVVFCCIQAAKAQQPDSQQPPAGGGQGRSDRGERGRGLLPEMTAFKTDVPAHAIDIVLVRPTRDSMTVSVVCYEKDACEGYVEYRRIDSAHLDRCATRPLPTGEAVQFTLERLSPDTAYVYRFKHRRIPPPPAKNASVTTPEKPSDPVAFSASVYSTFHTPRVPGGTFSFTIQADSHLDANVSPAVYLQTLANALADKPDFHIDLGDTFMTDKRGVGGREFKDALPQYVAQRYYFGQLCHSAPLFMVLGNHDGEVGYASDGPESMAPWSFTQRTKFFPSPQIDDNADGKAMYSGRTSYAKGQGANYYEFTWGEAQFIVLDPFWFTTARPRGGGGSGSGRDKKETDVANTDENWSRTLGKDQYDWLTRTLESSASKYRFVFIHHLVGGLGKANRGGVESSVFFEWGGKNADSTPGFAEHRPAWAMPIHDLLVKHKVSVVFHGHDHLYVRSERDGVVYQCVPQPGNPAGGTRSATEYGYQSGAIFGSPGYLRVRVGSEHATAQFIRSAVIGADDTGSGRRGDVGVNRTVVHQYDIQPMSIK